MPVYRITALVNTNSLDMEGDPGDINNVRSYLNEARQDEDVLLGVLGQIDVEEVKANG